MAQWAKQWTYLSNFIGEGSKPEQLYIFFWYFICNKNIFLYICINKSIFNLTSSLRFFNMVLFLSFISFHHYHKFIFIIIDIEGQYLKDAFYKHVSQK